MMYFKKEKFFFAGKYCKQKEFYPWDTCILCDLYSICSLYDGLPFCSNTTYIKEYETFYEEI